MESSSVFIAHVPEPDTGLKGDWTLKPEPVGMLAGIIFQIVFPNPALRLDTQLGQCTFYFDGLLRTELDESLGMQWAIMGNSHSNLQEAQRKLQLWCLVLVWWSVPHFGWSIIVSSLGFGSLDLGVAA